MDRLLAFIEMASVKYYARAVEGCIGLTLIGLALYVTDERVTAYQLVTAPEGLPMHTASYILVAAGIAQIVGVAMPLVHDLFGYLGFKSRLLTKVWVHEKTWRISAMVAAIALWGAYAGLMSQISWSAWLFAGSFSLLLTISIFRLEAMMDANRAGPSGVESIPGDDPGQLDDPGPLPHTDHLEMGQPPQGAAALGFGGNISN